eukprot:COSAG02_NODE_293_length_25438_cov_52.630254_8_plen_114_part_00
MLLALADSVQSSSETHALLSYTCHTTRSLGDLSTVQIFFQYLCLVTSGLFVTFTARVVLVACLCSTFSYCIHNPNVTPPLILRVLSSPRTQYSEYIYSMGYPAGSFDSVNRTP